MQNLYECILMIRTETLIENLFEIAYFLYRILFRNVIDSGYDCIAFQDRFASFYILDKF